MDKEVLERFLRYVKVDTMSDEGLAETRHPSTDCQWDLLHLLEKEMDAMGLKDHELDGHGILIARIPSNTKKKCPTIGLMTHVDTAHDVMGNGVKARVIDSYDGGDIPLNKSITIKRKDNPLLAQYKGETLVVSDGTTLLGADDKAGVAEVMTVAHRLLEDNTIVHGPVELYFTSDEETGCGMDKFPYEKIHADYCYTVDGGERYCIESECFSAYALDVDIKGVSYHPGSGRGRIVNAITVASRLLASLPQAESPEATDGRFGFYCPMEISGGLAEVHLHFIIRDFDTEKAERRCAVVKSLCSSLEEAYQGSRIIVKEKQQYLNMVDIAHKKPQGLDNVWKAGKELGMPLYESLIRGGTDGARMANERDIPCPNLFTGGHNFHSIYEWAALPAMEDSIRLIIRLLELGGR